MLFKGGEWKIEGYVTIKEKAEEWGISPRTVQIMCSEGRIQGATRFGNIWAVPIDSKRPVDGRITNGKYRNWRNNIIKSNCEDK